MHVRDGFMSGIVNWTRHLFEMRIFYLKLFNFILIFRFVFINLTLYVTLHNLFTCAYIHLIIYFYLFTLLTTCVMSLVYVYDYFKSQCFKHVQGVLYGIVF